jgi:membrane protease YdiL (CAAX protease family)
MNDRNSIRAVNILFLIVLILQASNMLFLWVPQYVRLTINQALFVFLPAYLYLRLVRRPVLPTVRWRWPGWKTGLLALLLGAGLYPISAASAAVLQQILGYSIFELPADTIPTTLGMGLLAIIAYAIMAPICEEFLFRGVIQPVYERRSPRFAILFVGLLFIVFHLSLLQGLSIVLLSLALGYVNNRTRSLQASIIAHFGANILAALVLTQPVFPTGIASVLFSVPGILTGIGLALVAFLRLLRLPQPEAVAQPELLPAQEPASPGRSGMRSALAAWWPMLVGVFYISSLSVPKSYSAGPPSWQLRPWKPLP